MNDVRVDHGAVQQFLHSPSGPVGRELERRARNVQTVAKALAPVHTGHLRDSIAAGSPHSDNGELLVMVGSRVHYAWFVEGGTSRNHPQPYLRPALSAVRFR